MEELPGAWKPLGAWKCYQVHGRATWCMGAIWCMEEAPRRMGAWKSQQIMGARKRHQVMGAWKIHQVHRSHYHDYSTIGPHTKGIERSGIITDWALIDTDNVMNVTNCNIHYNSQLDRQQVPRLKV